MCAARITDDTQTNDTERMPNRQIKELNKTATKTTTTTPANEIKHTAFLFVFLYK